jgi:DDE superfamily endonuclease
LATGKVTVRCQARHRHIEFLVFPAPGRPRLPRPEPALVMDNYGTHKHRAVQDWLAANPRVHVHFTPTHASWMNMVEAWFSMAERQAIHRGSYRSVRELVAAIRAYIDGWNQRAHPFTWTKDADEILSKINRAKTKANVLTDH